VAWVCILFPVTVTPVVCIVFLYNLQEISLSRKLRTPRWRMSGARLDAELLLKHALRTCQFHGLNIRHNSLKPLPKYTRTLVHKHKHSLGIRSAWTFNSRKALVPPLSRVYALQPKAIRNGGLSSLGSTTSSPHRKFDWQARSFYTLKVSLLLIIFQ
jgi:hypothetical protein